MERDLAALHTLRHIVARLIDLSPPPDSDGADLISAARRFLGECARSVDRLDLNKVRRKLDDDHYGLRKVKDRILEFLACILGATFFSALVIGSWEPFWDAWEIGEYEGEGALRVPTYPVRAIIILMGVLSALVYLRQLFRLIKGDELYE